MRKMDAGTVVVILLAAIIILAAIAIIANAVFSNRKNDAESYSIRMGANSNVLARLSAMGQHDVTIYDNGKMTVDPIERDEQDEPEQQAQTVDPRAVHAVRLVKMSLDEYGSKGGQIIPANKMRGMSPNTRDDAVKYLIERNFVQIVTSGAVQITQTKQPLAAILAQLPPVDPEILDKAVAALPRSSNGNGTHDDNGITADN